MLTLSEPLLDVMFVHLHQPLPLEELREHLRDGLGGQDAPRVVEELYAVDFWRYRPRTGWAQSVDQAVAKLERVAEELGGPPDPVRWADPEVATSWVARWKAEHPAASRGRRRRLARWSRSLDRALATLRRGHVLRICRSGRLDRVRRDQLEECPWTAVTTCILPELLPGLHLQRNRWCDVPWRARWLGRCRQAEVLSTWFAPPDIRAHLGETARGAWLGGLWERLRLAQELEPRDWRVVDAERRAWRELVAACDEEGAGDVLSELDPLQARSVRSWHRSAAFWGGFESVTGGAGQRWRGPAS